jgi:hypothetical protein
MSDVTIRPFQPGDRARVREICRASNPFEDEEVIPTLFADYYMDCEPQYCLVAESDGRVIGYILGATGVGMKRWLRRVGPRLALRVAWKIVSLQYRKRETYRSLQFLVGVWRHEDRLRPPRDLYPVECHFQVDPPCRSFHLGVSLLRAFGGHLRSLGMRGAWGGMLVEEGDERLTRYLCRKLGCTLLGSSETALRNPETNKKLSLQIVARDLTV